MFLASFHWLYFLCYNNDSTVNSAFSCWFHKDSKNLINLPYIPHPFSSFSFFHSMCGLSTPHRLNTKSRHFLVQFLYRKTRTDEEQFWSSQLVFTVFQIFWCPRDIVIQDQLATDCTCKPGAAVTSLNWKYLQCTHLHLSWSPWEPFTDSGEKSWFCVAITLAHLKPRQ